MTRAERVGDVVPLFGASNGGANNKKNKNTSWPYAGAYNFTVFFFFFLLAEDVHFW